MGTGRTHEYGVLDLRQSSTRDSCGKQTQDKVWIDMNHRHASLVCAVVRLKPFKI